MDTWRALNGHPPENLMDPVGLTIFTVSGSTRNLFRGTASSRGEQITASRWSESVVVPALEKEK